MSQKYDYDVIIIGAGISGLVCGSYLAKAGLKTLIIERNAKAGGYCTSFTRKEYHFDAFAHGLGSLRKGGRLDKIFHELGIVDELRIIRRNPTLVIKTPEFRLSMRPALEDNISEFTKYFPDEEKNIYSFFNFIASSTMSSFSVFRSNNLESLLNNHFNDERLKTILSLLVFGFVGLPPWDVSSVVACLILREFVLDGGYYPPEGMQAFPDTLVEKFKKFGGNIIFSKSATQIVVKGNRATGVILQDDSFLSARYVVSACDARHTFFDLIKDDARCSVIRDKIKHLALSPSFFLVYLGLKDTFPSLRELNTPVCH